jgi:hypothetical protein
LQFLLRQWLEKAVRYISAFGEAKLAIWFLCLDSIIIVSGKNDNFHTPIAQRRRKIQKDIIQFCTAYCLPDIIHIAQLLIRFVAEFISLYTTILMD